jgi:hypothetical protein
MMNFTIYNPATGEILYNFTCNDQPTADANLQGHDFIEGYYFGEEYYIDNQQAKFKGERPTINHTFDYAAKIWKLDNSLLETSLKNTRNTLLQDIDKITPVWYASLSAEQQTQLQQYRQALLDVPQQIGFPESVEWPAKPTWL